MVFVPQIKRVANRLIKRLAKGVSLDVYFPTVYRKAAKEPVNAAKVIFLEGKHSKLPDSYSVLYNKLISETTFDVKFVSLGQNRVRLRQYYFNCRDAVREIATAKYVFLNDASDMVSCLPLRDETKVVQLWHACGAFKKWGMSTAELKFGGTQKDLMRHPFYRNLSLVTVSSPDVAWAYVEAMVLEDRPEIVKALGVSRTDVFFDEDHLAAARERVEKIVPFVRGKRVILYAPTFRGRVASAVGPDTLDIAKFQEAFGRDSVLLIKHHPFVKKSHVIPAGSERFAFDVSGDLEISDLLCVADVCISDYSSLVFEYSLFGRPMLFFAYDIDDYDDWRGFYYDYDQLTPGPVFSDNEHMIDYLQHIDDRFDISEVEAFREKFMSACDGHATERICEEVFGEALATYHRPRAYEKMRMENPGGIDLSIVIPAHDAMPEFTRALESLARQTYDLSRLEVIIVDDCSSDGTWDEACRFAQTHPGLFVVERLETPSGSPAKPRNVGLEKARGKYVFFLDADDWLGEKAVEKMLDHAVEWNSDVLLVKMKGENGRGAPKSMFACNQPNVDVFHSKVMWTLGPLKLYQRELLNKHGLKFFEQGMPEDQLLVISSLVYADVVSVAADYDYYHVSWRGEQTRNTFNGIWSDFDSNIRSFRSIMEFVEEHSTEEERSATLLRRLLRLDVLNMVKECEGLPLSEQERRISGMRELFGPFYVEDAYRTCPVPERLVLDAAFFGDVGSLESVLREKDNLPSLCAYNVIDGRVFCSVPEFVGSISCDISDAISLNCKVEQAYELDDFLELQGAVAIPRSFERVECYLVLDKIADGDARLELPVHPLVIGEPIEVESGIPSVSASWCASIPFACFFDLDSKWELSFLCRLQGWEKAARLGPLRDAGVRKSFSSIVAKRGSARLTASLGPRGDMQIRIRKGR